MGKKILVAVDIQYDFCNPNGALFVPGGDTVVNKVKAVIPNFDYVIFTKDSHSLNHCSFKENENRVLYRSGLWHGNFIIGSSTSYYELFDDCVLEVYKTLYNITFKQEE